MALASANKHLRVRVTHAGKIVEERVLPPGDVTLGTDRDATLVVPGARALPGGAGKVSLFEQTATHHQLVFHDGMDARVWVGAQDLDRAGLEAQRLLWPRGDQRLLSLTDQTRGKITLGDVTVLFQFVAAPPAQKAPAPVPVAAPAPVAPAPIAAQPIAAQPVAPPAPIAKPAPAPAPAAARPDPKPAANEPAAASSDTKPAVTQAPAPRPAQGRKEPRPTLPPELRGTLLVGVDRLFLAVLGTSLLLHTFGATCIVLSPPPVEPELTLEELPDRFARVMVPEKIKPPEPVEVTSEEGPETKEAPKEVAKKPANTAPKTREEVVQSVQSKGLLKVLGSAGMGDGAFADVLGQGTGAADIALALAGAGGVGIATEASLGGGGPRGGGTGNVAGIGDLGTSGGGNVNLGKKREVAITGRVRDAAPEVDTTEVDRDGLARYVKMRLKAIQGCYERELKRNPTLKGRVVVRFTLTTAGRATDVEIEENSLGDEAVGACIRTIVRGWAFPFKPETEATVSYPFVFSPAS